MEDLMDGLWFKIVDGVHWLAALLDAGFAPLNRLGPAVAVFGVALVTVVITQLMKRYIPKTRRYRELKQQFLQLRRLRQEALEQSDDREKGKRLARNIDQAELNQVYYNYFFEGFLNGILTRYIPIFGMLAYVNESYRSERLLTLFGKDHIFVFGRNGAEPVVVGAVFWFVISMLIVSVLWLAVKMVCPYRGGRGTSA